MKTATIIAAMAVASITAYSTVFDWTGPGGPYSITLDADWCPNGMDYNVTRVNLGSQVLGLWGIRPQGYPLLWDTNQITSMFLHFNTPVHGNGQVIGWQEVVMTDTMLCVTNWIDETFGWPAGDKVFVTSSSEATGAWLVPGGSLEVAEIPEPGAGVLMLAGLAGLLRRYFHSSPPPPDCPSPRAYGTFCYEVNDGGDLIL